MLSRDRTIPLPISLIAISSILLLSGTWEGAGAQPTAPAQGAKSQEALPALKPYVKPTPQPALPDDAVEASKGNPELDAAVRSIMAEATPDLTRLRVDRKAAKRLAKYHWLDKAALANPVIIAAICSHKSAAEQLAEHPRLGAIGNADHYLCRRLTQWKKAARLLASSPQAREVITLDPEGIYRAIERDKKIIRILSKNPMFNQMIVDNPDLGRVIAKFM